MAKKSKSRSFSAAATNTRHDPSSKPSNNKAEYLLQGLPDAERRHLERCTLDACAINNNNANKSDRDSLVKQAVSILEQEHCLVLHNCLSCNEIQVLQETYGALREHGQTAIGEKDPTRRSGTRLYNCLCQLGPACDFYDWKPGAEQARACLNPKASSTCSDSSYYDYQYYQQQQQQPTKKKPLWKEITDHFHFTHIARVEVVTSHVGCRAQGWHIDGVHGLTVIMPLTDVGVRQGPTELDFSIDFVGLWEGDPKVRNAADAAKQMRAVMPAGSVLLFNANVSHRGSANIGRVDRPICVLDCSLESTCLAKGGPRDVWSV
ncbi:expressed unknown protein [Seminavis robusta]|uniref:Phytanoyl-CoA dioxygenase n=1 Tax=Seminavis robusta TaxID=568900 RepID=A0A9N8DFL3_9STRA|nr:expressed unknown protein [Seminavis robusta]|eukprot:Sro95_g049340.1 n/a (320) ;mRNA; r:82062-83021